MKVVVYKNVSISVPADVSDELAQVILERAANKLPEQCSGGEMTLTDAVSLRSSGANYQFCDEMARRAFNNELQKHLRPNP